MRRDSLRALGACVVVSMASACTINPVTGDRETTYLLPSEGLFYRRTKDETFLQQYQRFEGWILSAGDSVPFLPLKAAEADSSRSGPAQTR